jgi:hypothetical protein
MGEAQWSNSMGLTFFITNIFLAWVWRWMRFPFPLQTGLNEPQMRRRKIGLIALVFGGFQAQCDDRLGVRSLFR